MQEPVVRAPVFVTLLGLTALAMTVPALMATAERDFATGRAFTYGAVLLAVGVVLVALATRRARPPETPRSLLWVMVGTYTVLPLAAALPLAEAVGIGLGQAWFEMISAITTTGATLLDQGQYVPRAAHLWRAEVAWFGGFFTWVAAIAILAPMNLGGFEVRAPIAVAGGRRFAHEGRGRDANRRLLRHAKELFPIYAGLTFVLFVGLMIAGEDEFVALCHAMSVISTSGISPIGGLSEAKSGFAGEAIILLFFVFALSRASFVRTQMGDGRSHLRTDPELRLGLLIIAGATLVLFGRHWLASETLDPTSGNAFWAAWGTLFTVASFLSTTGFESDSWVLAAFWSGMKTPGLALIGLAVIGGGVATTAGGVRLMRVYALGRHMQREVQILILPHVVGGQGAHERRVRRQGAFIAWIMFMLFAMSVTAVMIALSLTGVQFETAMVLAVASLANCGPLAQVAAESPLSFAYVPASSQIILAAAMVVGRLEALAIIALFSLESWRR